MLSMENNVPFFEARIGKSFHYNNSYMDKYAWDLRREIFFKNIDVRDKSVCDIGCGNGLWMKEVKDRGATFVIGIEQSTELAENTQWGYAVDWGVESEETGTKFVNMFDFAMAITSLNFTLPEKRARIAFNINRMLKNGGQFAMIEYLPKRIPYYQKRLSYKSVWTEEQWRKLLTFYGLRLRKSIKINWVDTTLFHYFGGNKYTFMLTCWLDKYFTWIFPAKYKLLIFEKYENTPEHTIS